VLPRPDRAGVAPRSTARDDPRRRAPPAADPAAPGAGHHSVPGAARVRVTPQRANFQRVAPWGSAVATPNAVEREPVQVPRRRPGAGGAVLAGERVALHLGGPPNVAVAGRHPLQGLRVRDAGRLALEHKIDALLLGGDRAGGTLGEVARLPGPRPAREVEIAVDPDGADPGGVGAQIGTARAQEE